MGIYVIEKINIQPTWRNIHVGVGRVIKHLDQFLVDDVFHFREWTRKSGMLDHMLVLKIENVRHKSPRNEGWIHVNVDFREYIAFHF